MKKITEQASHYRHLEQMSTHDLVTNINTEDQKVAIAVSKVLDNVVPLVDAIVERMRKGGRLFYIGAGTSGRLGILDASECPPTFGVSKDVVIGIIAGGDKAIREGIEFAEDDNSQAWKDLSAFEINETDVVVGIAASGTTPYVIGGLDDARKNGLATGCITCNPGAPVVAVADYPIVVVTGPEFVTGSTRMKAGTAQKMVLNMITTSVMIRMGRVMDNKMVDMQLANNKLLDRGAKMLMGKFDIDYQTAERILDEQGSVRSAIEHLER